MDPNAKEDTNYGVRVGILKEYRNVESMNRFSDEFLQTVSRREGGNGDLTSKRITKVDGWNAIFMSWPYYYTFEGKKEFGGYMQSVILAQQSGSFFVTIEQMVGYHGSYDEKYADMLIANHRYFTIQNTEKDELTKR